MSILRLAVSPREHIEIITSLVADFYDYSEYLQKKGHTSLSDPTNHFYYHMSRQTGHTQAAAVLYRDYRNVHTGEHQLHVLERGGDVEEMARRLKGLDIDIPKVRLLQSGIATFNQLADASIMMGRVTPSAVVFHDTLWRGGPKAPDVVKVINMLEQSSSCPARAIFLG